MADVGIVMPVYIQDENHLRLAIQSIRRQTYPFFEFIIVIDGAPQQIIDIVKDEVNDDKRVTIKVLESNQGVAHALNQGFHILETKPNIKYLTWVSSDNIYYPNFIERLHEQIVQVPPQIGIVYSSFNVILDDGSPAPKQNILTFLKDSQGKPKEELMDVCFIGYSFLYKSSFAQAIGDYRLDPVQDFDYWLRLTEICDIAFIPDILVDYRIHSQYSLTSQLIQEKERHRKFYDAYHQAQYEARRRRNIPPEITIVYLLKRLTKQILSNIEQLLDQKYSNYKMIIADSSPNQAAKPVLQIRNDLRLSYIDMPLANLKAAIYNSAKHITTPYTVYFYDDLQQPIISTFYRGNRLIPRKLFHAKLKLGELYRSGRLLYFLKKFRKNRFQLVGTTIFIYKVKRRNRLAIRKPRR